MIDRLERLYIPERKTGATMITCSYSFLRDFENCSYKAYRKYVKRDLPKETSAALEEGILVHEMLERAINDGKPLSFPYATHADILVKKGAKAEVKLGMTKDMLPAGFFDDPWLRGKVDVLVVEGPTAFIVDWKTGKVREDPHELRVQAMLVRANYPEVNRISGCYVWLKEGKMGKVFDLTDINETYHETARAMDQVEYHEREGEWPLKPNPLCGWCPVKDCRFNTSDER